MNLLLGARFRSGVLSLALLLAFVVGCNNKSDTNPVGTGGTGGTGGTTNPDLDPDTAQQQAFQAIEMTNGLTASVDALSRGDFTTLSQDLGLPPANTTYRNGEEIVWDPALGAWVLDARVTEVDASGSATIDVYVWIQFLDSVDRPMQEPTEATAKMALGMDMTFDVHAEDQGEVFDIELDYATELAVSGLPDGPYLIDGDGTMSGSILWTGFGDDLDASFTMGWSMDLLAPAQGCPTGTIDVDIDQYSLTATYDGDSTFDWVMYESGNLIDSGTDFAQCSGVAVN